MSLRVRGLDAESGSRGNVVETGVFHLVEEGAIADVEELGGLGPVPVSALEHLEDLVALGSLRGFANDVLEEDGGRLPRID
jgi:hypothetical protein